MVRLAVVAVLCGGPLFGGAIEGRVTNGVTGEPVSGATVRFVESHHSYSFTGTTDASGAYRITGLTDGDYRGEFSKKGFLDFRQGATLEDVINQAGVHVSGDVPSHLDGHLQPWGTLHGRVVHEEGKPASGVTVQISRSLDNVTTTSENGSFGFDEIRPGSYTITAKPATQVRVRDGEQVGDVPVSWPSAIKTTWGSDVQGIEIRLKSAPVHRISGVVLDQAGRPTAHATVRLLGQAPTARGGTMSGISGPGSPMFNLATAFYYTSAPGPEPEVANVESHDDGTFEFAVERGDYRIAADIDPDERPRSGVASVAVGDKDIEGVSVRLSGPFSVEVSAIWGGVEPPKPKDGGAVATGYLVHLSPLEGQPVQTFDPGANPTSVNGAFPGRYRVMRFSVGAGMYLSAVMYGGRDVLGQVIDLVPGLGPLGAIVKHDGGIVRGVVENGRYATVFLVPRTAGEVLSYMSALCGSGGTFEFKDVVPGSYYLAAFDHGGELPAENLPDALIGFATDARVESGASGLPINLPLNKWPW